MKKMKLSSKAVLSLILSAVLFCMPALGFAMNGNYAVSVHAEDTEPESSSEENSTENDTEPEKRKKRCSNRNISFLWCEGWDLNPHSIATASTSSWCVCHSATLARNDIYYIIPVGSCQ